MKNYGIRKSEDGVRWTVCGGGDRPHRADEGGDHISRTAAEREARDRASRSGGMYVGVDPILRGDDFVAKSLVDAVAV